MGADTFYVIEVGKSPADAFSKAVSEAQYLYGHAGYTGTIAEKGSFINGGKIGSRYAGRLESYVHRAREWYGSQGKRPRSIPEAVRDQICDTMEAYDDKWGPAVCFEITGNLVKTIKEARGRKGSHDKVFVFCGWASS